MLIKSREMKPNRKIEVAREPKIDRYDTIKLINWKISSSKIRDFGILKIWRLTNLKVWNSEHMKIQRFKHWNVYMNNLQDITLIFQKVTYSHQELVHWRTTLPSWWDRPPVRFWPRSEFVHPRSDGRPSTVWWNVVVDKLYLPRVEVNMAWRVPRVSNKSLRGQALVCNRFYRYLQSL